MKDSPAPNKRRRYDAAFRAEALRPASESHSNQAATRALNIDPKLAGAGTYPHGACSWGGTGPGHRHRTASVPAPANRWQAQELEILKKAIASCLL